MGPGRGAAAPQCLHGLGGSRKRADPPFHPKSPVSASEARGRASRCCPVAPPAAPGSAPARGGALELRPGTHQWPPGLISTPAGAGDLRPPSKVPMAWGRSPQRGVMALIVPDSARIPAKKRVPLRQSMAGISAAPALAGAWSLDTAPGRHTAAGYAAHRARLSNTEPPR